MLVHERLGQVVQQRGLNQSAIADRIGVPQQWLNARLLGRTKIKADEVQAIAEAIGVDACWLLTGREEPVALARVAEARSAYITQSAVDQSTLNQLRDYIAAELGTDGVKTIRKLAAMLSVD